MVDSPVTFVFELAIQVKVDEMLVLVCKLTFAWYGETQLVMLNGVKIGIGLTVTVCEQFETQFGLPKFCEILYGSFGLTTKLMVNVWGVVVGFVKVRAGGTWLELLV